jgi:Rrf2 family transcriptional regulator, iron-sulfur cluster assembly transcription factor
MQITRREEYALRGVIFLAKQPNEKVTLVGEVSRVQKIPEKFLAKIFQRLAKAGVLRSMRGAKGGFLLRRPADEITMREVLEAMEGPLAINRCLLQRGECVEEMECPLHEIWEEAQKGLLKVLERTTIKDLVRRIPNGMAGRR